MNGKNLNLNGYQLFPKKAKATASNIMQQELLNREVKKVAIHAYKEGVETVSDCLRLSLNKAIEAGHQDMKLAEVLQLIDKVNEAAQQAINKQNEPELPPSQPPA